MKRYMLEAVTHYEWKDGEWVLAKDALAAVEQRDKRIAGLEARVQLLESDMKSGDYESLYAQTVAELQQMEAERDALKAALEIAYDYAMSWIDMQRCAYRGYKPELFAQWEKDEEQMRAALAAKEE